MFIIFNILHCATLIGGITPDILPRPPVWGPQVLLPWCAASPAVYRPRKSVCKPSFYSETVGEEQQTLRLKAMKKNISVQSVLHKLAGMRSSSGFHRMIARFSNCPSFKQPFLTCFLLKSETQKNPEQNRTEPRNQQLLLWIRGNVMSVMFPLNSGHADGGIPKLWF